MINNDNFLYISSLVAGVLVAINILSYIGTLIFCTQKTVLLVDVNNVYDPDLRASMNQLCLLLKEPHSKKYTRTPCMNKTFLHWYNPWVRHRVWNDFWVRAEQKRRAKKRKEAQRRREKMLEYMGKENRIGMGRYPERMRGSDRLKGKSKPAEFFNVIIIGFLSLSALVACWEILVDKYNRNHWVAAKAQDRQCTLADFTINRHLRRESQQLAATHIPRQGSLERTAKVTQTLYHQSSLDRAFPKFNSEVNLTEGRRNSVSGYPTASVHLTEKGIVKSLKEPPSVSPLSRGKRQSVDVTSYESTLEVKRKARHLVRRH